jgi:ABC-2 type transport system permease protein
MMRGLFQLTWLEIKIFMREPMGAIGTLLMPVVLFLVVGRAMNRGGGGPRTPGGAEFLQSGLPVMASVFMAISAVISLVTIISIWPA